MPTVAATSVCERCTRTMPSAEATYSTTGKLLCWQCRGAAQFEEADQRAANARRSMKIFLGVALALAVLVPGLLFATGQGVVVAHSLVGIGVLGLVGGNTARRMFVARNRSADPFVRSGVLYMMAGGALAFMLGMFLESRF